MILRVNPNRMELLRLRRRLQLARRGHKLLKDKQEELMRQFMALVVEAKRTREDVDRELEIAMHSFFSARLDSFQPEMEEALAFTNKKIDLKSRIEPIMNLRVPYFDCAVTGEFAYGFLDTDGDLDRALSMLSDLLPRMVRMAQLEKHVSMLAAELERTRRRVNALEHILIPSLQETIKYISTKLSELERGNLTRLMKVKEIVRKH
ncbi:MAG: V-type ATP synthase subunit D [Candidatus Abyssobacteria bacterium SURF_17]|uniref:V-type ATP synthase subunit D n=1 Tax=Candidatus Abyssobacteria bacterium SURF_17 TaxID=2093361 RepID=A0A419F7T2_9BACT|nr:MAG: V-type ATP synthase subunit D [Candidatus Abyssubacteria bacterium SURF_17]